jgi:limonene-1,2-epoxide hydrolase
VADRATLRVNGFREFVRATNRAGREARSEVRRELRAVAEPVKADAARRFEKYDKRSAAHLRVQVTQRGVFVVQNLRKTTGLRPYYGALQMRKALLPALHANESALTLRMSHAIDVIADHFDQG